MSEFKVIVANVGGQKMVCTDKGNGTGKTVCLLNDVPKMKDQITQLEKDKAELELLVEKAFIEGCSTGYSEGLSDGQSWSSNKCSLDKDAEWEVSETKELLERIK